MWPFQINMKSHTKMETSKRLIEMGYDGAGGTQKAEERVLFPRNALILGSSGDVRIHLDYLILH